jgi:cyanophycinase
MLRTIKTGTIVRSMVSIEWLEPTGGPLVIVGGAEDKTGACVILRELVRLAGGALARIAVVTVASGYPSLVGARYVDVLTGLGAGHVEPVHVEYRAAADDPASIRVIEDASAVYFTGGIQSRIARRVGGSALAIVLHARWRAGLVVGGTSAGAAAMSEVMIVGGGVARGAQYEALHVGEGLGFVPGVIVDQHFRQRRRLGRLHEAVTRHPEMLGMGIDEDTAVVLRGDAYEVIGSGGVTLVKSYQMQGTDDVGPSGDHRVSSPLVTAQVLSAGQRARLTSEWLNPASAVDVGPTLTGVPVTVSRAAEQTG